MEPHTPESADTYTDNVVDHIIDSFLTAETLPPSREFDCPYLPGLKARSQGFWLEDQMEGRIYLGLMDRGFRRSGRTFYRPQCSGCKQCIPYRVPVAEFKPTRGMRRIWKRNADVRVEFGDAAPSDDKHDLFKRYLDHQHDGTMTGGHEEFERFLYDTAVPSIELLYYIGRRLAGVSILDVCPGALSSVYMYFEPALADRSLGTFSILWEIDHCRRNAVPYYYLGYYVPGSRTMAYKARFQPGEILDPATGRWRPIDAADVAANTQLQPSTEDA